MNLKKHLNVLLQVLTSSIERLLGVDNRRFLVTLFPVALAISIYVDSLFGDFVHDDVAAIVKNPDVRGENDLAALFSNDFWGVPMSSVHSHKSYRPVTVLLFR